MWYSSSLSIAYALRDSPSLRQVFFLSRWHDIVTRSQFCVIPAHTETTSNHRSEVFKETARGVTRSACCSASSPCSEERGRRGGGGKERQRLGVLWNLPKVTTVELHGMTTTLGRKTILLPVAGLYPHWYKWYDCRLLRRIKSLSMLQWKLITS